MNYDELNLLLKEYPKENVSVYVGYLSDIEANKDKNKWFNYFKPSQAASLFKKVALDGLLIDGDSITLSYKGKVMADYNYQAYKNKLLNIYPETLFDLQIVSKGDAFEFRKENGKVIYKHVLGNPFSNDKQTIGAYCIIKNNRGQFIEVLNMKEIGKMKNVAKTKNVWNTWEDEMVLKSVIKRACKRHFKDIVTNIEALDNENYDLDKVDLDFEVQEKIENSKTATELTNVYNLYKSQIKDEPAFLASLTEKRKELEHENS